MLVRQVEEELLHRLKTGQYIPGEKLPSIREMCGEFGCSYVIAFRAVQSLKQSGCLETFKGSGTFVARDVQKRLKKKLLAYIFDKSGTTQLNLNDSLRYTCFQRMIREAGYMDLALQEDESFSPDELDNLAGALITLRTPQIEELVARRIPCVFISSLGNPYGFPSVIPDFYQGSCDVMRHMLRRGYCDIRCVTIDSEEFNQGSFVPRVQAYRDVLKERGFPIRCPLEWDIRKPETRRKLREIMSEPHPPDSFFVPNDKLAVEVVQVLGEMGFRVPEDIGVAGLENMEFLYTPGLPLTSASFDNLALVREACSLLLKWIEHPAQEPPQNRTIPMSLIERKSTVKQQL